MAEMSQNDKAYITVTDELIRLQNDLEALKAIETIMGGINTYQRERLREFKEHRVHSDPMKGFSRFIKMVADPAYQRAEVNKVTNRIEELKTLAETYMTGGDIVLTKLSKE